MCWGAGMDCVSPNPTDLVHDSAPLSHCHLQVQGVTVSYLWHLWYHEGLVRQVALWAPQVGCLTMVRRQKAPHQASAELFSGKRGKRLPQSPETAPSQQVFSLWLENRMTTQP